MAYLMTFLWGWLLLSLLLGSGMGWIAVVHRGQAVSKVDGAVAGGAGGGAGRVGACPRDPGPAGLLARPRPVDVRGGYLAGCAMGSWLRDRAISRGSTPAA